MFITSENTTMYVYIETENWTDENGIKRHLYTVGFYKPSGAFEAESDHETKETASLRVHYLNGGLDSEDVAAIYA